MHHDATRILGVLLIAVVVAGCRQRPTEEPQTKDEPVATQTSGTGPVLASREVEASCGQCKLGLEGAGCTLAVRFDGQTYYVDGTTIDDHGDAHAVDGFCNAIRKAIVSGHVEDGRFVAESFEVLPSEG